MRRHGVRTALRSPCRATASWPPMQSDLTQGLRQPVSPRCALTAVSVPRRVVPMRNLVPASVVPPAEKMCCGVIEQDLTTVPGSHHPRSAIQHRTEVVRPPKLCFTGRNPHPYRQFEGTLCGDCGIDGGTGRREGGTHAVTGVLEQPAPVRLNRPAQHLVMGGQRHPHPIGVGLPPTGRTLDIGEQKRHHPRRSSRPISGHPRRLSQRTRAYLALRRNPTQACHQNTLNGNAQRPTPAACRRRARIPTGRRAGSRRPRW